MTDIPYVQGFRAYPIDPRLNPFEKGTREHTAWTLGRTHAFECAQEGVRAIPTFTVTLKDLTLPEWMGIVALVIAAVGDLPKGDRDALELMTVARAIVMGLIDQGAGTREEWEWRGVL